MSGGESSRRWEQKDQKKPLGLCEDLALTLRERKPLQGFEHRGTQSDLCFNQMPLAAELRTLYRKYGAKSENPEALWVR